MREIGYIPHLTKRASALRDEGVTRWMLHGPEYESPFHGVHRATGVGADQPGVRIADAVALLTNGCALTGWAARWIQGQAYCDGAGFEDDVPVTILSGPGSRIRTRSGLRSRERRWLPGEVIDLGGFAATTMARATYDDMLDAPNPTEALVAVEMASSTVIEQSRTTLANVGKVFDSHVKTRGRVQARWAIEHASTRSASPWETRTRVLATQAVGIDDWLINVPVFDPQGVLLGISDLLDPTTGLVVESDGHGHREEDAHNSDNVREEDFEHHGLTVVRVGSKQHSGDERERTKRRIRAGRDGAVGRRRRWTTEKPPWWWDWPPGRRWD